MPRALPCPCTRAPEGVGGHFCVLWGRPGAPNVTLVAGPVVATGVPGPTVNGAERHFGAWSWTDYGRVTASFTPRMPRVYLVRGAPWAIPSLPGGVRKLHTQRSPQVRCRYTARCLYYCLLLSTALHCVLLAVDAVSNVHVHH